MKTRKDIRNEIKMNTNVEYSDVWYNKKIREMEINYNIKPQPKKMSNKGLIWTYFDNDANIIKTAIQSQIKEKNKPSTKNFKQKISTKGIARELEKRGLKLKKYTSYSARITEARKELGIEPIDKKKSSHIYIYWLEDGLKIIEYIIDRMKDDYEENEQIEIKPIYTKEEIINDGQKTIDYLKRDIDSKVELKPLTKLDKEKIEKYLNNNEIVKTKQEDVKDKYISFLEKSVLELTNELEQAKKKKKRFLFWG